MRVFALMEQVLQRIRSRVVSPFSAYRHVHNSAAQTLTIHLPSHLNNPELCENHASLPSPPYVLSTFAVHRELLAILLLQLSLLFHGASSNCLREHQLLQAPRSTLITFVYGLISYCPSAFTVHGCSPASIKFRPPLLVCLTSSMQKFTEPPFALIIPFLFHTVSAVNRYCCKLPQVMKYIVFGIEILQEMKNCDGDPEAPRRMVGRSR